MLNEAVNNLLSLSVWLNEGLEPSTPDYTNAPIMKTQTSHSVMFDTTVKFRTILAASN